MAIFANNISLFNHSSSFRASPCSSSSLKTHVKFFLRLQSAGTANRGLKSLPSHHSIALKASTITEAGAQTQRWNTKTTETTPIIDVHRYLNRLKGQKLEIKECGDMRFGPKGWGERFYDTKKEVFIFERWWWFCNMPTPVTAQPRPSRVREWSDTKGLVSNLVFWSFSPLHSTKTDRIKSFWILKLIREETEFLNKQHQNRPSKSNRTYSCSWIMKAMISFYVFGIFYWQNRSITLNLRA